MNHQGFAPILVILIIVFMVGGGLVVTKQVHLPFTQNSPQLEKVDNQTSAQDSTKQPTSSIASDSQPSAVPKIIKTGTLKGKVAGGYYLKVLPQTTVTIQGEGLTKTTQTDSNGIFTFSQIPVGKYNLSFYHPEYNISNVNDVSVSEKETFYPKTINGFLKVINPTIIKGTVFVDRNDNRQKDSGEEGLDALINQYNRVGDNWSLSNHINADKSGNFSFEIKEDGISYKLEPTGYTYYRQPPSVEFVVEGQGGTKEFSFPYYPTVSTSKLFIFVFNDKNENSTQDNDEEYIDYYYADITNISTGKNEKASVDYQGISYSYSDFGTYKVKLVAGNDSWASYYKITKVEDTVVISNNSGDQTVKLGAHKLY